MLYFLLMPAVRFLKRCASPSPRGPPWWWRPWWPASLSVYALSWPASEWVAKAPESLRRIEDRAQKVLRPIRRVTQTAEQMERIATLESRPRPEVTVSEPGLGATVFGGMQAFLAGALVVFTLLFFLLAAGDRLLAQARARDAATPGPQARGGDRAGDRAPGLRLPVRHHPHQRRLRRGGGR